MAKKKNKISINAFEKVMKEEFPSVLTVQWRGIDVEINHTLSMTEMLEFVKEVVENSFLEDGSYLPEVTQFLIWSNVLTRYANFTMPSDLEKQYLMVCSTSAPEFVAQHINQKQFREIVDAIEAKIGAMCDADALAVRAKLEELNSAFANMGDQFADMFQNIKPEDVSNAMVALEKGEMSEERLVREYMKQMGSKEKSDEQ